MSVIGTDLQQLGKIDIIQDGDYLSCYIQGIGDFRLKLTKYRMMRTKERLCSKLRFRDVARRICSPRATWEEITEFFKGSDIPDKAMVQRFWDLLVPKSSRLMTPRQAVMQLPRYMLEHDRSRWECLHEEDDAQCRVIVAAFIQSIDPHLIDFEDVDDMEILMRAYFLISNQPLPVY